MVVTINCHIKRYLSPGRNIVGFDYTYSQITEVSIKFIVFIVYMSI